MECWACQVWHRDLYGGEQSVCWTHFLFRMNAKVLRHFKEIHALAKMMLGFLICFFASRIKHLLSLDFLRAKRHRVAGIKFILTQEKLELHDKCLKSLFCVAPPWQIVNCGLCWTWLSVSVENILVLASTLLCLPSAAPEWTFCKTIVHVSPQVLFLFFCLVSLRAT